MVIINIINSLLKIHWVNSKINIIKRLYFNYVFLPNLLNSLNHQFCISKYFDLNIAFTKSPVKGLINSIFNPNEGFFNALDLSVAINIAINGFCNEKYVDNSKIIDSAIFICENLKKRLYDDKILKEYLAEMDKKLHDFIYEVDRNEIENVLKSKTQIFTTYFKKFNNPNYSPKIIVYHQSQDTSWVDYNTEDSIIINHSTLNFREGFFLLGFDYKLTNGEYLRIATADENGIEHFNPKEYNKHRIVWAS